MVKEQELEGIVLKKEDSKYRPGTRSNNWIKIINYQHEHVYITSMT
ncbi:hypothetical protein [Bacillus taeanensis]|uniref:ATP-dependent DNA ligase family profile domain-containing protein n=1 Tax=Bacillus taeanensis TaxID=273032 RepID=A0A366XPP1_9BACI|nr:hypothetical protein DS031_18570 [Bacillus taeanensis]